MPRLTRRGPRTPEGLAAVTATIMRVNTERQNVHRPSAGDAHGAHAITRTQPATAALAQEILAMLAGDGLGHIRQADRVAVELLAVALRRIHQAEAYLDRFGLTTKGGAVRPVAQLLTVLLREARGSAEALGMTPTSRAKLGLETARTFDLAAALASQDADTPAVPPDAHPRANIPTASNARGSSRIAPIPDGPEARVLSRKEGRRTHGG